LLSQAAYSLVVIESSQEVRDNITADELAVYLLTGGMDQHRHDRWQAAPDT